MGVLANSVRSKTNFVIILIFKSGGWRLFLWKKNDFQALWIRQDPQCKLRHINLQQFVRGFLMRWGNIKNQPGGISLCISIPSSANLWNKNWGYVLRSIGVMYACKLCGPMSYIVIMQMKAFPHPSWCHLDVGSSWQDRQCGRKLGSWLGFIWNKAALSFDLANSTKISCINWKNKNPTQLW